MARIKNILVPVDFSNASKQACGMPASSPTHSTPHSTCCTRRSIVSCRRIHGVLVPPPDFFEQIEQEARKQLESVLTREEQARYGAVLVYRTGVPATEILDYVRAEGHIDLIVMATHGRGGVARLMMGSVADKVVRGAPCPSPDAAAVRRSGSTRESRSVTPA